jgi:hypothetical protein
MDPEDTMESAIHFLQHLGAEGWVVAGIDHRVEFKRPHPRHRRLPYAATVTVRLKPSHP